MIKLSKILSEIYPLEVGISNSTTQKHENTPKFKNFAEINAEYPGHNHHLRLKCAKCNKTETCRCSAPKTEIVGVCYKCAGVNFDGTPS